MIFVKSHCASPIVNEVLSETIEPNQESLTRYSRMFTLLLTLLNSFLILLIFFWIVNTPCEKCGQKRKLGLVLQDFFDPHNKCWKCKKEERTKPH